VKFIVTYKKNETNLLLLSPQHILCSKYKTFQNNMSQINFRRNYNLNFFTNRDVLNLSYRLASLQSKLDEVESIVPINFEPLSDVSSKLLSGIDSPAVELPVVDDLSYSQLSIDLTNSLSRTEKKSGGIFFTPPSTIEFAIQILKPFVENKLGETIDVLEPSCGSGEWIGRFIAGASHNVYVDAVEFDKTICDAIRPHFNSDSVSIFNQDFLSFDNEKKYDFIVGNPPYFQVKKSYVDSLFYDYFVGQPNMYILFIVKGLMMLKDGGVLSYVVPPAFLSNSAFDKARRWIYSNFKIIDITFVEDKYLETKQKTVLIVFQKPCDGVVNLDSNDEFTLLTNVSCVFGCKSEIDEMKSLSANAVSLNDLKVELYNANNDTHQDAIIIGNGFSYKHCYTLNPSLVSIGDGFVKPPHTIVIVGDDIETIYNYLQNENTKRFIKLYSKNSHLNTVELLNVLPIFVEPVDDEPVDEVVDEPEQCPICYEYFQEGKIEMGSYCAHPICSNCCDRLHQTHRYNDVKCPICRVNWNTIRRRGRPSRIHH
jgi:tRNA1(Val) A37 N6-methylase TrmN6